jgi:hypothetical protein
MRLNPDCIRDILFYIEEHTDYLCWVSFPRNPQNFNIKLENDYPANVILYHLELCKEYGYIEFPNSQPMGEIQIKRLSVSGHEFLENIRNNNTWNKTKEISQKLGTSSLNFISQIASNVISDLITRNLK